MYKGCICGVLFTLLIATRASGGAPPTTDAVTHVPFVSYEECTVSSTYKPDSANIFAVIGNDDALSAAIVTAPVGAVDVFRKGGLESRAVMIAIRRDRAVWSFVVNDVIAGADGNLTVRYSATSRPTDQVRASALVVSVPRDVSHAVVKFEENGTMVGNAEEEWLDDVADAQWETARADAELNAVYQKLMATLDPAKRKQLVVGERAWIAYRDAEIEFCSQPDIGSGSTRALYQATCLKLLTEDRIKELQGDLEDMSPK